MMQQPAFLKANNFFYSTSINSSPLTLEWKDWLSANEQYVKTRIGTTPSSRIVVLESPLSSAESANRMPDAEFMVHSCSEPGLVFVTCAFDCLGRRLSLYAHVLCFTKKAELAVVPFHSDYENVLLRLFVPKEGTKGVEMHVVDETGAVKRVKLIRLEHTDTATISRRSKAASDQNRAFSFDMNSLKRSFIVQCSSGGSWRLVLADLDSISEWTFDLTVLGGHSKADQKKCFLVDFESSRKRKRQEPPRAKCIVLVGGTGVGKSCLLNCLMGCVTFASGFSTAPLTRTISHAPCGDYEYYDTPALSNQNFDDVLQFLRSLSDESALVCFVATLESMRLKDSDRDFISRLASKIPPTFHFKVIVNKCPRQGIVESDVDLQIQSILPADLSRHGSCFFQRALAQLSYASNAIYDVRELSQWVHNTFQPNSSVDQPLELFQSNNGDQTPRKRISTRCDIADDPEPTAEALWRTPVTERPSMSPSVSGENVHLNVVPFAYISSSPYSPHVFSPEEDRSPFAVFEEATLEDLLFDTYVPESAPVLQSNFPARPSPANQYRLAVERESKRIRIKTEPELELRRAEGWLYLARIDFHTVVDYHGRRMWWTPASIGLLALLQELLVAVFSAVWNRRIPTMLFTGAFLVTLIAVFTPLPLQTITETSM